MMLINVGYNMAVLVFQKVDSLSDLLGRNVIPMGGFAVSILLSSGVLKKINAEIRSRG